MSTTQKPPVNAWNNYLRIETLLISRYKLNQHVIRASMCTWRCCKSSTKFFFNE